MMHKANNILVFMNSPCLCNKKKGVDRIHESGLKSKRPAARAGLVPVPDGSWLFAAAVAGGRLLFAALWVAQWRDHQRLLNGDFIEACELLRDALRLLPGARLPVCLHQMAQGKDVAIVLTEKANGVRIVALGQRNRACRSLIEDADGAVIVVGGKRFQLHELLRCQFEVATLNRLLHPRAQHRGPFMV